MVEVELHQLKPLPTQGDEAAGRNIHLDGVSVVDNLQRRRLVGKFDGREGGRLCAANVDGRLVLSNFALLVVGLEGCPMGGPGVAAVTPVRRFLRRDGRAKAEAPDDDRW